MAYFQKYYYQFQDAKLATWRIDIFDSEGAVPTEPFLISVGGQPIFTERINTSEQKYTSIIGRQITISYIYDGTLNTPDPTQFFEADERRFRVEVRKNGVIDGVYWIRPDFCEYPFHSPPYEVKLTAVDGLSFAAGTLFNMDDGGLLKYDKISLYEAMLTRGLFQVIDPTTPVNVLQSLYPDNIEPGQRMLFGLFVHTDIFYDFVEGANNVRDVNKKIADNFYARLFLAKGELWFIRTQDLNQSSYTVDRYTDASTVTSTLVPDFKKLIGPDNMFDGIPITLNGKVRMVPAVKKADFEVEYRGFNVLKNFMWSDWDGTFFDEWGNQPSVLPPLDRDGAGTLDNPYRAFMGYGPNDAVNFKSLSQILLNGSDINLGVGDIIQFSTKYSYYNTKTWSYSIIILSNSGDNYYLESDGKWSTQPSFSPYDVRITQGRAGKKMIGSSQITSFAIPNVPTGILAIQINLIAPDELSDISDGPDPAGVFLYPIKLGIITSPSKGRHLQSVNSSNFSYEQPEEKFTFIDTGGASMSNTIFAGLALEPAEDWDSDKAGVEPRDLELHMAGSHIDQYQRSVKSLDVSIYSNNIDFQNVMEFSALPGVTFMQLSDRYNNRTCEHQMTIIEVFEEGTGEYVINEWDIEEEREN